MTISINSIRSIDLNANVIYERYQEDSYSHPKETGVQEEPETSQPYSEPASVKSTGLPSVPNATRSVPDATMCPLQSPWLFDMGSNCYKRLCVSTTTEVCSPGVRTTLENVQATQPHSPHTCEQNKKNVETQHH